MGPRFPLVMVGILMTALLPEESDGQITIDTNTALLGLGGAILTAGAFGTGYFLGSQQNQGWQSRYNRPYRRPYYGGRGRREAAVGPETEANQQFLDMLEQVLRTDKESCTLLLTCHVASLNPDSLTPKLVSLLLPFENEDWSDKSTAYAHFKDAVTAGKQKRFLSRTLQNLSHPTRTARGPVPKECRSAVVRNTCRGVGT
ncbi:uncharacterized protein LOC135204193 [Macrobrachium nipponense]|uniref:uncharacterized protein LOC135204193 n=1 Tax=Macrobrachium nipponense TaxID=159736 RepID=UPI0030C8B902